MKGPCGEGRALRHHGERESLAGPVSQSQVTPPDECSTWVIALKTGLTESGQPTES